MDRIRSTKWDVHFVGKGPHKNGSNKEEKSMNSKSGKKVSIAFYGVLAPLILGLLISGCATPPASVQKPDAAAKPGQPLIEKVQVNRLNGQTQVTIQSSGVAPYSGIKLMNPPRIYVDIKGVPAADLSKLIQVKDPLIQRIQIKERKDQAFATRLEVALAREGLEYHIDSAGANILLKVMPGKSVASSQNRPAAAATRGGNPTGKKAQQPRTFFKSTSSSLAQVLGVDFTLLSQNKSRLTVTTSKKVRYTASKRGPKTVVLDIKKATARAILLRRLDSKYFKGAVERVKASVSPGDQRVRIRIALREPVSYEIRQTKSRLEIDFGASLRMPPQIAMRPKGHNSSKYKNNPKNSKAEKKKSNSARESERYVGSLANYAGQKMSFDFVDTDIRNVLKLIAEVMGVNIVWGSEVKGKISLKLDNVPWDQALEMILKPSDLTYQIEGNVMWVVPRSKLIDMELREKERRKALLAQKRIEDVFQAKVIEFIKVRYRKVKNVYDLVSKVMDVKGALTTVKEEGEEEEKAALLAERDIFATYDASTNMLIVHGIRTKVEKVKALVAKLDVPERQVMIEARIVDATTNFTRDLGVQWDELLGQKQTSTGVAFGTDPTVYPLQRQVHGATNFTSNAPTDWVSNVGLFLGRLGTGGLSALTLSASLALAEEEGKTKIISAPKVIASSGEEAVISRGDKLIIPATEQVPAQEIEATLSLTVTPTISSKDSINIDVKVTDDRAASITQIIEKKIETSFLIKSGETVVIGGIFREDKADDTSGIPVLQKIPLLGWAFKAEHRTHDKSELLIFLTATIIPTHRLTEALSSQ
jgi:type IV pilus assembly protein PilQ